MNIIIVLRFDTPFPKKAVQRYDKKIKNMTFGCGNVLFFFSASLRQFVYRS